MTGWHERQHTSTLERNERNCLAPNINGSFPCILRPFGSSRSARQQVNLNYALPLRRRHTGGELETKTSNCSGSGSERRVTVNCAAISRPVLWVMPVRRSARYQYNWPVELRQTCGPCALVSSFLPKRSRESNESTRQVCVCLRAAR